LLGLRIALIKKTTGKALKGDEGKEEDRAEEFEHREVWVWFSEEVYYLY
jgi:hypothetical protein